MKKNLCPFLVIILLWPAFAKAQINPLESPCSHAEIMKRQLIDPSDAEQEMAQNERLTRQLIQELKANPPARDPSRATYIIPLVVHVFHIGNDGKIGMEQIQSGLDVLNADFNGLNDGWNTIHPAFDSLKGTLDIEFCLASIDPEGNPTSGVVYYEDELGYYNKTALYLNAWDQQKYLNIYLPKFAFGEPSNFTAYAYYPWINVMNERDGIYYSSYRWGYGGQSVLTDGQDRASVVSHEAGHWLNLRHTFENGCDFPGDLVKDTPPTLGGTIYETNCDNNDLSCRLTTNGENYMDYNHDCKKMFTQGQVERMTAALHFRSRINLWSTDNLIATGCLSLPVSNQEITKDPSLKVYPNPLHNHLVFESQSTPIHLTIRNTQGQIVFDKNVNQKRFEVNTSSFSSGIYFYELLQENGKSQGKLVKHF